MSADPHRSSWYLDDAYYARLVAWFGDWQRDTRLVGDAVERDRYRALLEREARLLDQARYDDWLAMFVPECVYWAPASVGDADPRREVAIFFDDRRRMEDRVFRLRNAYAWSQAPASRTVRLVSNVEVFAAADDASGFAVGGEAVRMVRANFLVHELRAGEARQWAGWSGYRIRDGLIVAKQVNLIDRDRNLRNPSIVL